MDSTTLNYYDRNAEATAAKYRAVDQSEWRRQIQDAFPAGARVLDVYPPRNGRTSKALTALGFDVKIHSE